MANDDTPLSSDLQAQLDNLGEPDVAAPAIVLITQCASMAGMLLANVESPLMRHRLAGQFSDWVSKLAPNARLPLPSETELIELFETPEFREALAKQREIFRKVVETLHQKIVQHEEGEWPEELDDFTSNLTNH
jgi:hypothetical protein